MKVTIVPSSLENNRVKTMDTEDLTNFRQRNKIALYFDAVINHANIEEISEERIYNKMLIYSNMTDVRFNVIETIDIEPYHTDDEFEIDTMFFDSMQNDYKKADMVLNMILFRYEDKDIAYYDRTHNLLCTTDWTHDFEDLAEMRKFADYIFGKVKDHIKKKNTAPPEEEGIVPTMGHDIELEMANIRGRTVNASGVISNRSGRLGVDGAGAQVELRPSPSRKVSEVVEDTKKIMKEMVTNYNGYKLCSAGDRFPIGGHIHVGLGHPVTPPQELLSMLDAFLGIPTQKCNGKARGSYARLGAYESKNWGFEYRSIPGAIGNSPEILELFLKCVQNIVNAYTKGKPIEYENPPTKEDYVKYCKLTDEEYDRFCNFIENFDKMNKKDVLKNWLKDEAVVVHEKSKVIINFADDWNQSIRDDIERLIKEKLKAYSSGIVIRIYGINQNRGPVVGFSLNTRDQNGNPVPETIDTRFRVNLLSAGDETTYNSVSFGLPHRVRTDISFYARNNAAICDAIVKQLEPYLKERKPTKIRNMGELRCA